MFKVINHGLALDGYDTIMHNPVGLPVVRHSPLAIFGLESIPVTNGFTYFWGDKFRWTEDFLDFPAFDDGMIIQYIFI